MSPTDAVRDQDLKPLSNELPLLVPEHGFPPRIGEDDFAGSIHGHDSFGGALEKAWMIASRFCRSNRR
jgi:hypothetical protein